MAFILLLLLSITTLVQIETRSAQNRFARTQAEMNALLAMNIALGELQRTTGPDQRVTALADIAGTSTGDRIADGVAPANNQTLSGANKGLSAVQPGTRFWTGVFTNTDSPDDIYTKTPTPALVQWLVSGSRSDDPLSTPTLTPDDPRVMVGSNGQVADTTKAVVLVGKKSIGSASDDPFAPIRSVAVPLVEIGSWNDGNAGGRFGWWVGDEGQKARLNIAQKDFPDQKNYASLVAQRRGWETVTGLSHYPPPDSPQHSELARILANSGVKLLLPELDITTLQNIFHSATTVSVGLLTDSLNGGTRIDLTAVLSEPLPNSPTLSTVANYPASGDTIIPTAAAPLMVAPRWDALKDFHDRAANISGGSLRLQAAKSDFETTIAPLITDFRILMGLRMIDQTVDPAQPALQYNPCAKIAVMIANPYSVPLTWSGDLELEVTKMIPNGSNPTRLWEMWARTGNSPSASYAFLPRDADEPAVFNNAVFRIPGGSLGVGEARAYTLANGVLRPNDTSPVSVPLAPFASSAPFDFGKSLELDIPIPIDMDFEPRNGRYFTPRLRILESGSSSLLGLEMRHNGSLLLRIDRFEIDNGFTEGAPFDYATAIQVTEPIGILLYNFQLSQPGGDYASYLPASYDMGMRASTLRTFADFNLQATRYMRPIASYNPPPFFMEVNDSPAVLPRTAPGGDTGPQFTRDLVLDPSPWGRSPSGTARTVLFSVPEQLSSIALLQHADLTGDDNFASIAHQPGNAVGNSWAPPFVKRSLTRQRRTDYVINSPDITHTYYDLSYLLNASLWDSYFFSMIPSSGPAVPENPTIRIVAGGADADLRDPVRAASSLMVDGTFNINSTDKNAWKAFLASATNTRREPDRSYIAEAAFPRSLSHLEFSAAAPTGTNADSFAGFRLLSDSALDALATEIVRQVRLRGPFISLSHFINRSLADVNAEPALSRSGALQAAIDESGLNINHAGDRNAFTGINAVEDRVTLRSKDGAPRADMDGPLTNQRPASVDSSTPDWATTSLARNYSSVASIVADREMILSPVNSNLAREQGYRSTGIPGWLTQADLLQVIGPSVSARSDTFRIRAYGESVGMNGGPKASAWCEAIVQRMPEYVDPANLPSERGSSELSPLNQIYGRTYEIISFRWLNESEI
jgi:hypothetical protein